MRTLIRSTEAQAWLIAATVTVVTGTLLAMGEPARQALRFAREAIIDGEVWRLVSGHLVHLNVRHWLLNIASLFLFLLLLPQVRHPRRLLATVTVGIAAVDLGLLLVHQQLAWYVGLSGGLYALPTAAAVWLWDQNRHFSVILMALLAVKFANDLWLGPPTTTLALIGGEVVAAAHVYGALGGLLTATVWPRAQPGADVCFSKHHHSKRGGRPAKPVANTQRQDRVPPNLER